MNRPEAITPRDWAAMPWHARQRAAARYARERRARLAALEAERPTPRRPDVDPWHAAWLDYHYPDRSKWRQLIYLIEAATRIPTGDDERACADCGEPLGRRSRTCWACHVTRIKRPPNHCPDCGVQIGAYAKRCRSCAARNQHRRNHERTAA